MENTALIALSRQAVLRRQMEVTANNLANMNTAGFKAQRMLFLEYVAEPDRPSPSRHHGPTMVTDRAVVRDLRPGPLEQTDNSLDLALHGDGYLTVGTDHGPRYTRNGRLGLDPERRLVTAGGLTVLDENNRPLTIPPNASQITVTGTGEVSTEAGPVGKLALVRFDNPYEMVPLGGGMLVTNEIPKPATGVQVVQRMVEQSNVEPIVEMTQMIEIARQYQSTQQLMDNDHDRMRSVVQRLGRAQ